MDNHIILVEKILSTENLFQDLFVISSTPIKITSKGPVRITANPKAAPLIITTPGPIPYPSDKATPWNYGSKVYYHGVKQELSTIECEGLKLLIPPLTILSGPARLVKAKRFFLR